MSGGVTVNVRGQKEAIRLLDSLSGNELQNRVRRGTRAGAKVFREETRSEAKARSDIPDSFAKTATKGHRTPVGTSTGPTSPLLNIFEVGAGSHPIVPGQSGGAPIRRGRGGATRPTSTGKGALAGTKGERWRGSDFFTRAAVRHPGMTARPLIGPIFEAKDDEATNAALDSILEGIR